MRNKAQALDVIESIETLGRERFFLPNGKPCCLLGHLAAAAGYVPPPYLGSAYIAPYGLIEEYFGLDFLQRGTLITISDSLASTEDRKKEAIAYIQGLPEESETR